MGSFSVACGMSHIPITGGEHVLFLPIKKNRYLNNLPIEHFFCYADDLYEPALLPIEGFYNTYGNLERIIKNDHTNYLEKQFNNSIEVILNTITRGKRDLFSKWNTELSSSWGLIIYENNLDSFYKLGFELIEEENKSYMFSEKHKLSIFSSTTDKFKDSNSYIIKKDSLPEKTFNSKYGENLQEFIFNNFNILLGLKDEKNMIPLLNLYSMGGQFFLKSVFDEMTNISFSEYNMINKKTSFSFKVSGIHLLALGFKQDGDSYYYEDLIKVSKTEHSICEALYKNKIHKFFNLREFLDFFRKKIVLDETKLEKFTFFNTKMIELQDLLKENLNDLENLKKEFLEQGKEISTVERIFKRSSTSIIEKHLFGSNTSFLTSNYIDYFYDTSISFNINKEYFLLDYYSKFSKFRASMVATNNLFIPSFCGYQDGAKHVSKHLAKITLKILNQKEN